MTLTDASAPLCLALDVGATKVDSALITEDGKVIEGSRHRARTGDAAVDPSALGASIDVVVRRTLDHPRGKEARMVGRSDRGGFSNVAPDYCSIVQSKVRELAPWSTRLLTLLLRVHRNTYRGSTREKRAMWKNTRTPAR